MQIGVIYGPLTLEQFKVVIRHLEEAGYDTRGTSENACDLSGIRFSTGKIVNYANWDWYLHQGWPIAGPFPMFNNYKKLCD